MEKNLFILNGQFVCCNFAHELALTVLAKVLGPFSTAIELTGTTGFEPSTCQNVTLSIGFRMNLNLLNPKIIKDLIGYCSNVTQNLTAERPSYHLVDVMTKSARGLPGPLTIGVSDTSTLTRLPTVVLDEKLVHFLSARDLRALNKTCKALTHIGRSHVPGLKPQLFRHQRASLFHMEQQEINPANLTEIFVHKVVAEDGSVLLIDIVSGRYVDPRGLGKWRARRGGLLCDAPGIGKTVATLALILRTKGMLPLEVEDAVTQDVGLKGFNKRRTPPRASKGARYDDSRESVKTTLVVVPHALVNHWRSQITQHVESNALQVFVKESIKDPWPQSLTDVDVLLVSSRCLSEEVAHLSSFLESYSFLRVIIDEGHSLGTQETRFKRMCRRITAERFWVVTGTPAKLTNNSAGLEALRSILTFLRASSIDPVAFTEGVARGFKSKDHPPCEAILVRLLKRVLIRHRKQDVLAELPELVSENRVLRFGDRERDNYNLLVSFIRANLILTSIGTTGGWDQSLLNPNFVKRKMELLMSLRSACVGSAAGEARRLSIKEKDVLATIDLFSKETVEVQHAVNNFMLRTTRDRETFPCAKCGLRLNMLLVTRCAHLYCTECISPDASCHVCSAKIDADDLAEIQPGFGLERIVLDLGSGEVGAKAGYIIRRIEEERYRIREERAQMLAEKKVKLPPKPKFIVFSQFRESLNIVGDQLIRRFGTDSVAEFWGKYQSVELDKFVKNKVNEWVCERCHGINTDHLAKTCTNAVATVVVYTPNGPHGSTTITLFQPETQILNWVPDMPLTNVYLRETRQSGMLTKVARCGSRRNMAAPLVPRNVDCDVLLLSREGSHGLDLSCTTHVFILDLVWDAAVEEQIVSRAWRLGNKAKRVIVEHLVMKDSMEELLVRKQSKKRDYLGELLEQSEGDDGIEKRATSDDPRIKYIFENIRLVRPD